MPFDEPEWADADPSKPVTAEKLRILGTQYATVAEDADDATTPVGAAVARAVAATSYTDNGNGTITLKPGAYTDHGDGTITLGG